MRLRGTIAVLSALSLATLALAGCSSGGNSTAGAGGGGSQGNSGGTSATATFTGDITGTIQMNLCTDSGADSIFVLITGDSTKYLGNVSADGVGFVGPDAADWARDLDKDPTQPVAITGGTGGYSVDGVHVYSGTKEITLSGKLVCP